MNRLESCDNVRSAADVRAKAGAVRQQRAAWFPPQPTKAAAKIAPMPEPPQPDAFLQFALFCHVVGALARAVEMERRTDIATIQQVVASRYRISRSDILSDRRTAHVVRARHIAMYLAKTLTLKSLPEIGRRFGGRDHTTVLHALQKIRGRIAADLGLALEISALREEIERSGQPREKPAQGEEVS